MAKMRISNIVIVCFMHKGFQVEFRTYSIQNRFSGDALVRITQKDKSYEDKAVEIGRDFINRDSAEKEIVKNAKEWIDNYIENGYEN